MEGRRATPGLTTNDGGPAWRRVDVPHRYRHRGPPRTRLDRPTRHEPRGRRAPIPGPAAALRAGRQSRLRPAGRLARQRRLRPVGGPARHDDQDRHLQHREVRRLQGQETARHAGPGSGRPELRRRGYPGDYDQGRVLHRQVPGHLRQQRGPALRPRRWPAIGPHQLPRAVCLYLRHGHRGDQSAGDLHRPRPGRPDAPRAVCGDVPRRAAPPDQAFTFILVNVHTDPDETEEEFKALAQVYQQVAREGGGEDDIILWAI